MKSSLLSKIREYMVLGLLTVGPLALTIYVFMWLLRLVDNLIPAPLKPFPGLGVLLCLLILLFVGMFAKTVAGKVITTVSDSVLGRLPVIRSIYAIIKQVSSAIFSGDSQSAFKRVVYVSFFSPDCRLIAFVTGEIKEKDQLVLFVPTAPNPTSGYTVFFPKSKVEESKLTVEEAVKIIVSCGSTLRPDQKEKLQ